MNNTELFIIDFYKTINILDTDSLSISSITDQLDVNVHYWEHSSAVASFNYDCCIFIDNRLNEAAQWQDFGHEMYHYFFDDTSYNQLNESYGVYGESKADYFAYHFCVPTFMLSALKGVNVYDVMNLFNVEFEFAMKRMDMYQSKLLEVGGQNALQENHY